jgi:hypothetical protein
MCSPVYTINAQMSLLSLLVMLAELVSVRVCGEVHATKIFRLPDFATKPALSFAIAY